MSGSYFGKDAISHFLDTFHPFATIATEHHGTFIEPYEARNLAELGGYEREFDDLVAGAERFVSKVLTGDDVILHVSAVYPVHSQGLIVPGEGHECASKTFTFEAPEWLRPLHPDMPRMRLFRLKCGLDRESYRTGWTYIGNEIRIDDKEGAFAYAVYSDGELFYRSESPENARERRAMSIAEDLGFIVYRPVHHEVPEPDAETRRLMLESQRYHEC